VLRRTALAGSLTVVLHKSNCTKVYTVHWLARTEAPDDRAAGSLPTMRRFVAAAAAFALFAG
jgi:hypothetical protein